MSKRKRLLLLSIVFTFLTPALQISGQNFDIRLLRQINLHRNTSFDGTFKVITNSAGPLTYGTPAVLFGISLIKKDSVLKRNSLYIGASVLSSLAVTTLLKYSINRKRPYKTYPYIQNLASEGSPSFPSGHTSDAFSLATSLSLTYHKWYIIVPSFTWAVAVAYSRLDLGVHYPSDVLMGAVVGAGSSYLCFVLNKKLKFIR